MISGLSERSDIVLTKWQIRSLRSIRLLGDSARIPAPGNRKGNYIFALRRGRGQVKTSTTVWCKPSGGVRRVRCEDRRSLLGRLVYRRRAKLPLSPEKTIGGRPYRIHWALPRGRMSPLCLPLPPEDCRSRGQ